MYNQITWIQTGFFHTYSTQMRMVDIAHSLMIRTYIGIIGVATISLVQLIVHYQKLERQSKFYFPFKIHSVIRQHEKCSI